MVIDELPALEYIPEIENMLVYGRGYGVTLMGFAQTLELIQSLYPKTWHTFLSSAITIFFDVTDSHTADYVSKRLGTQTIGQESQSHKKNVLALFNSSEANSTTISETSRPLLTPDEVTSLGSDISVVFMKGQHPMLLRRPTYFRDSFWKGKFDDNPLEKRIFKATS